MGPAYRYGELRPQPYPPFYWAQSNVARPRPIPTPMTELEPFYYYKESPENYYRPPHEWSFNYGGGPYWHCPEYEFYSPKFSNYEGDGRDFRPHTYIPPPSPYAYTRPFNPGEQFRHPDDYPMRFVPATCYDRFGPYPPQQHCCGCPNHVFHSKPVERTIDEPVDVKRIKDSEDIDGKRMMDDSGKRRSENLQELPEPVVWIPGSLSDRNEEKHPVYWVPLIRKSIEDGRERPCPGYWVPQDSNTVRHDKKHEDENGKLPPFPIFWMPTKFAGERDSKVQIPSQGTKKTDGGEAEKVNESIYGKSAEPKREDENGKLPPSFPMFWIPTNFAGERDSKVQIPPQETKKTDGVEAEKVNESIYGKSAEPKKEDENGKLPPPFPIFWIPTNFAGERDSKVQIPPQDTKKTDGGEAEKVNEGIYGKSADPKKEKTAAREIPVKQLEEEGKPTQAQKIEERASKVPDNHNVKKASSPRASKLPPVCLRVDPLPKKKLNGTNSSRSPSPPRKVEESKDKVAVKAEQNAISSSSKVDTETKKSEQQSNMQSKEAEVRKKTEIDRDQAALKIQALYRGNQVRKFQSLRKLREIMKVKGRVEELRQQMSSPEFVGELSRDSKARGKFNETLMGLLLQLDTFQGLHPVVRDVRKSVARELTTLQEKLDTLVEQACADRLHEASSETAESDTTDAAEKMKEPIATLEVTETSGDTLLKTSSANQQIENDKATIGENVENTGSIKEEVLEVENKATKDGENVEEKAPDKQDVLHVKNEATKDGGDLEEKGPIKQEGCVHADATTKDGKYEEQKVETVNQDNTEEKDSMILTAQVINDNITAVERNESGSSNVRLDGEKLLDSALLKEVDVINEKLSSTTLGQEHGFVEIENEKLLDSTLPGEEDFVNEKLASAPLEEELAIVDIENEKLLDLALTKQEDVVNEKLSSVALEQEQANEDMENVNTLDEKPAMGSQDHSIVSAPEAEIDPEKIAEKYAAPVSHKNEDERDVTNALTEETEEYHGNDKMEYHGNDKMEFAVEVHSGTISHAIEEKILARMEETLPSNENTEGEEKPAPITETQSIGKPVETVDTVEADLSVQNAEALAAKEELLLPVLKLPVEGKESTFRCGEILQETECVMADMEDKSSIESKSIAEIKVEEAYVVNTNESESKILQCEVKQDHEKWKEENEKLKEMVGKLMAAGKLQMSTIVKLNDKIKQLEDKVSQGKAKKRRIRGGPLKLKGNVATNKRN